MLVTPESSPRGSWIAKIFGPAKPLLLRVGDRQPVQQALVVSQRQRLRLLVGLPLHRSLPPARGTSTRPILYHTLLKLNRAHVGSSTSCPIRRAAKSWLSRRFVCRRDKFFFSGAPALCVVRMLGRQGVEK